MIGTITWSGPCCTQVAVGTGDAVNVGVMVGVCVPVGDGITVAVSVGGRGVDVAVEVGVATNIPVLHADNKIETPKVNANIFFILLVEFPDDAQAIQC